MSKKQTSSKRKATSAFSFINQTLNITVYGKEFITVRRT